MLTLVFELSLWLSAFKWIYLSFSPLPSLLFFSQLSVRSPQITILSFCLSFSWGLSLSLPPVQYHKPLSIVLQALSLSDLIPWIHLSLPLYNRKGWFRSYLNDLVVFPTFFNLSLNLAIRSSWSEPQSAPSLLFADYIELSPSLPAKNIINLISLLTIWWCPCVDSFLLLLEEGVCCDKNILTAKLY